MSCCVTDTAPAVLPPTHVIRKYPRLILAHLHLPRFMGIRFHSNNLFGVVENRSKVNPMWDRPRLTHAGCPGVGGPTKIDWGWVMMSSDTAQCHRIVFTTSYFTKEGIEYRPLLLSEIFLNPHFTTFSTTRVVGIAALSLRNISINYMHELYHSWCSQVNYFTFPMRKYLGCNHVLFSCRYLIRSVFFT